MSTRTPHGTHSHGHSANGNHGAAGSTTATADSAADTADSIGERIDAIKDSVKDSVKGIADFGTQKASDAKDKAYEIKNEVFDGAGTLLDQVTSFIKANPLAAVGIAFGVGYIAMRLFRR